MISSTPYLILDGNYEYQEEIKKSRFITYVAATKGRAAAEAFVRTIKEKHADARHNCWAFVAGRPGDGRDYGFSDDGEPSGTAGKPILNTLIGSGIGEITVVVTRYYGGIKLGTGGLVRAYSGGLQAILKEAKTKTCIIYTQIQLTCDYSQISVIERLLPVYNSHLNHVAYHAEVEMTIDVDASKVAALILSIKNETNGQVIAKTVD